MAQMGIKPEIAVRRLFRSGLVEAGAEIADFGDHARGKRSGAAITLTGFKDILSMPYPSPAMAP